MTSTQQFFVVSVILAIGVFLASLAARADVCPDLSGRYQVLGSSDVITMTQTNLNGVTTYTSQHGDRPVTKDDRLMVGQPFQLFDLKMDSACVGDALEIISTNNYVASADSSEPLALRQLASAEVQNFIHEARLAKQNVNYTIVRTATIQRQDSQLISAGEQNVALANAQTGAALRVQLPLPVKPYAEVAP